MNRRTVLGLSGTALAGLAGCTSFTSGGSSETSTEHTTGDDASMNPGVGDSLSNPSFETALEGWTVGRDLPDDPNERAGKVATEVGVSTRLSSDKTQSLRLFIDGSQDDGTVWVQQRVDLSSHSTLSIDIYNDEESFNRITQPAIYTGPEKELEEKDFDRSNSIEDHSGWKTYEYDVEHGGVGLLAVGMNVIWETGVRHYFDNVVLS